LHNDLFVVDQSPTSQHAANVVIAGSVWHGRLGHRILTNEEMRKLDIDVPKGQMTNMKCDACEVSKHTHSSFPKSRKPRAKDPLGLMHVDLWGPAPAPTIGGKNYAMVLTDEVTRMR